MSEDAGIQGEGPVLVAYDGSEYARRTIVEAGELIDVAEAVVLHVIAPAPSVGIGSGPALEAMDKAMDEEALKTAAEGAELARKVGFDASPEHLRSEPVWKGIVDRADALDASVIVMGSKGRSGMSAVLLGSVATAVAQHTRRPVLIIH